MDTNILLLLLAGIVIVYILFLTCDRKREGVALLHPGEEQESCLSFCTFASSGENAQECLERPSDPRCRRQDPATCLDDCLKEKAEAPHFRTSDIYQNLV
jgi:hypothetical protein